MFSLDNYFILHGLVVLTVSLIVVVVSWIFMQYTVSPIPFSFSRLCQGVASGAVVVFGAIVINKWYPLSFFKIVVPAMLCAAVVHSIIIVFNLHLQHLTQQTLLKFPKFLALSLNYAFFAAISIVTIHFGGATLEVFFYYLTDACIKVGVLVLLYLLMKIQACQISEENLEYKATQDPYYFSDSTDDSEMK